MGESSPHRGPGGPNGRPIDWSEVLARHDRWLRTAVLARLGEPQAVDEVMQEVALAAVTRKAPPRDASRVGAWLHRLAVLQTLLFRRKHGRRRRLIGDYAQRVGQRDREPDPLDWLLLDERRSLVRQALQRLAPREAEVLLLKYTENWGQRDLAAHLGLSESAVEARLQRARKKLREVLVQSSLIEVSEP